MFSVFDIDQLQSLLRDFYRIAHIRITVFDDRLRELVSWPPEVAPCCAVTPASFSQEPLGVLARTLGKATATCWQGNLF